MADPVSWFVIEHGWEVVDAGGNRVGDVREVVGDSGKDIFNGLAVGVGVLKRPRYVPSESVGLIEEGRVHLTIGGEAFDALEEHGDVPPSEQFRAD